MDSQERIQEAERRTFLVNKHGLKLYKFVLLDDLKSVLQEGILPKSYVVRQPDGFYTDISDQAVQSIRANKSIKLLSSAKTVTLHDFVPLYLTQRTPTSYVHYQYEREDRLVFIDIDTKVVTECDREILFTTGNASSSAAIFHRNLDALGKLPWSVLKAPRWIDQPNGKHLRSSEFLIYPHVHPKFFSRLVVNSEETRTRARAILQQLSRDLPVDIDQSQSYFFSTGRSVVRSHEHNKRSSESDRDGWNLHRAAQENSLDVSRLLIEQNANVNARDFTDATPLHFAAHENSFDVARLLIEKGAKVEVRDNYYSATPLHYAAEKNSLDVARLLIEKGAEVDVRDMRDEEGWTALHYAAQENSFDMAKLLIEHGAETDGIDLSWLNEQEERFENEYVSWLIERERYEIDLSWTDKQPDDQEPPQIPQGIATDGILQGFSESNVKNWNLHRAAQENRADIAQVLIDGGVDKDVKNNSGYTPLHMTAFNNAIEVSRVLIDNGADIKAVNARGYTPLYFAALGHSIDVIRLLIKNGANLNVESESGNTPMHIAVLQNFPAVARLLLQNGAAVNVPNVRGVTPLSSAALSHSFDMARLLIEYGANTNGIDLSWMDDQ